ncbi:MAG: RNA polymerase subunit sigma-24 [Pseudopedobacter saltans]|uniref:RNA polymerase subunit sigma-24 n=1 Tax=Pseudopedobacter saltans TaxID=151895 RepID=A0A2W5F1J5_9SPHI|nr:MAG: RNA polymerase subunit sigma-24 [Pseudopedobacter saltans]
MQLCRQGKSAGFGELYKRYSKAIFNSILRLVNDFAHAEDILQEVFVTIYQEIMKPKDIEHFGGYAKKIAMNRAISFLRQNKRIVVFEDYNENILEEDNVEEEDFELKVEDVKKAINALPDGFRTVVNLYLVEGLPQEDIAELLGVSHSTVRTQYHRAKKKILSLLQKEVV